MSVTPCPSPARLNLLGGALWCAAALASPAFAQQAPAADAAADTPATTEPCAVQPSYPLPRAQADLRDLADRLDALSQDRQCLRDANFHAWRGAVLMALGRPVEALEPLERALLTNPDLFGAQLDLAQAHAAQGDTASAAALLQDLRLRAEIPPAMRLALDREIVALRSPSVLRAATRLAQEWRTTWQVSVLGGYDSNLNNAPSAAEVTLTLPSGDVTLPLDPASRPQGGGALLTAAQWQGLKPQGESVWVLQAEARTRHTGSGATGYQQMDLAANWLQAPLAPRQWVARVGASYFSFGGSTLLWASRASLQYQWEGMNTGLGGVMASCRPTAGAELERRLYPSSRNVDGYYRGGAAGIVCRPAGEQPVAPPVLSIQARYGEELPFDDTRAGGVYRRAEIRGQWDGAIPWKGGLFTLRWASTHQGDSAPYSVLLANVPRKTLRHSLQLETAWPISQGFSLISNFEGSSQRSNLPAFDSRQVGIYLGLRWESM